MKRLNGWQRLGIIASVLWIVGAWITTMHFGTEEAQQRASDSMAVCNKYPLPGETCSDKFSETYGIYFNVAKETAALAALAPVPIGWGLAYLAIWLVRWVRRGFQQAI